MTPIPTPNSCGECGRDERDHGIYYSVPAGIHTYVAPTEQQRLERMRARRAAR